MHRFMHTFILPFISYTLALALAFILFALFHAPAWPFSSLGKNELLFTSVWEQDIHGQENHF